MAEIVDFGLQKHKIKMDSRYFDNVLSVVAGDTGRRIEVQLLDTNGMVQNTTGLNLRLNAIVEGKATYTDANLVDAATGKYQLDLSNGMFLAPGNWQFQWQITDSVGKKLHSFAFTGNVGKNISEGGSQATNFYLNLDDLKAMQEDLVNGTFDSETLETNIAEKLTNLESEYAPKLAEVTAQLAQNKKQKQVYGEVRLPENFPLTLDFNLFRKSDGIIYHDINVKHFKIGTKIYVSMDGTSVSDGLTPDTPTRTISDVSRIINGIEDENIIIVFLDHFFRATFWENALINLNKNLYFTSALDSGTTIINGSINMDWTLDNNLLKANRTQAQEVFYSDYRDEFNRPKPLKKVSSITESQSSLFSYYTDGVSVWVNIPDKKTGTRDDLNVLLALANSFTIQNSNKRVVFDNLNFYMKHPSTAKSDGVRVNGTQDSVFYAINSSFRYAGLNGIGTQSVGRVYILNSVATDNSVDGFNYHGSHNNFVFEYNSTGFDNGTPSENSANVTTAHDGLTILRVGSIGYRCYGPLLADVNGCYSVNIDCRMYETLNSANSFWFSDSGGTKLTEAYLINCEGGSGDTVAIGSNISNPVNVYNMPELTKTSRTIIKEITLV